MHLTFKHSTTQAQAKQRVVQALQQTRPHLKDRVAITEERWDDATLHFACTIEGHAVSGTLSVGESDYVLDAKLPLMWRLFEGKIEQAIRQQVEELLTK